MAAVESLVEVAEVPQITSNMTIDTTDSEESVKGNVGDKSPETAEGISEETPRRVTLPEPGGDVEVLFSPLVKTKDDKEVIDDSAAEKTIVNKNVYPDYPDPNMFKKHRHPGRKTVQIDDSDLCSKNCMGYKLGVLYSQINGDDGKKTKCKDCPDTCMGQKVGKFAADLDAPEGSKGAPLDTPCAVGTWADLFDTLRCLFSSIIYQENEKESELLRKEELLSKKPASASKKLGHRTPDATEEEPFIPCFCKRRRVLSSPDGMIQYKMNDEYCLKCCDCKDSGPEEIEDKRTCCDRCKEQFFKTNKDFQKWRRHRNAQTDIMREKMEKLCQKRTAVAKKKIKKKMKKTTKKAKKIIKKAKKKTKAKIKKGTKAKRKKTKKKASDVRGDEAPKEGDRISCRDLKDIICSSYSSLTVKAKTHNEEFKARREAQAEEHQRKLATLRELASKQVRKPCACKQMEKLLQEYDVRKSGLQDANTMTGETPETDLAYEYVPDTANTESLECDIEMGTCNPRLKRLAEKAGRPLPDNLDCVCESLVDAFASHGIKAPKLVICKGKKQPGILSKICIKFEEIKSVFIKDDCTKTGCLDDKRSLNK